MNFKQQTLKDLDIFLNSAEFAKDILVNGVAKKVLFDEEYEVVSEDYENGSHANVASYIPAITLKSSDSVTIKSGDKVTIDGEKYFILEESRGENIVTFFLGK